MRTVQEITQTPLLQLNKPKLLTHGMKIYNAPYEGGAFTFKLNGITTPFAPSVFNGTGEETRQSVVFSIPEDVYKLLRSFEDGFKAQLSASECPKVEEMWHSSLKPSEKYAATFRAKINLSGDKACTFFTTEQEATKAPSNWRGLEVNAVIRIGGVYTQARGVGMLCEVTHLQYEQSQEQSNPFA